MGGGRLRNVRLVVVQTLIVIITNHLVDKLALVLINIVTQSQAIKHAVHRGNLEYRSMISQEYHYSVLPLD